MRVTHSGSNSRGENYFGDAESGSTTVEPTNYIRSLNEPEDLPRVGDLHCSPSGSTHSASISLDIK
jgi:hypothetical protein